MTRSSRGYLLSSTILPCCPEFGNALSLAKKEPKTVSTEKESPKMHCRDQSLPCQEVWIPGGATATIVVRSTFCKAPHLVIVHAFPLYRCERCGQESFHGSDRTAVTRALERSLVKGRPLPAEIEFDVALMADTLNEAGFVQGTPVPIVAAKGKRGRHDVLDFDLRLEKMRERRSSSCNQAGKICIDELIEGGTTVILPVKGQYVSVYGVPTYRCKVCGRESYPVESLGEVTRTLQKTKGGLPTEVHFDSIGSFSQPIQ
jgi:DNA-directed RNA polymerase subunit RPC12/RpoP